MPLQELVATPDRAEKYDFAAHVAEHIDSLDWRAIEAQPRPASGLETYLLTRLEGIPTASQWIDAMPFYAAAKTCEMIGAVATFGPKVNLNSLGDDDLYAAGGRGFAIASGGPTAVGLFLDNLRLSHKDGCLIKNGPAAWFGRLYHWLAYYSDDQAYDSLRQIIRNNLMENVPLAPGEILFGEPVTYRRLHSLRTAFLETGLHPTRLRKVLSFTGHIPEDNASMSDHAVVFNAAATSDLLGQLSSALTFQELGPYLNANRVQERLLLEAGFLRPVVDGSDEEVGWRCFARAHADAFRTELHRDTIAVPAAPKGAYPIQDAARRACCHSREIVELILGRKLAWIGRLRARPITSGRG